MTGNLEALPERVDRIEQKLDSLAIAVDERFEQVDKRFDSLERSIDKRFEQVDKRFDSLERSIDKRFDEVTQAIVEQRQYTEFAFERLERTVERLGVATVDQFQQVNQKLDSTDQKLDRVLALLRTRRRPRSPKKR